MLTGRSSDEGGRPYEVRLPAVNVEENGGPAVVQRPIAQIGYNTFGNTTNGKDARGNITAMVYDRLGRKTRIDHPNAGQGLNNVRELFTYDASGNLASQTDKRGNITSMSSTLVIRLLVLCYRCWWVGMLVLVCKRCCMTMLDGR